MWDSPDSDSSDYSDDMWNPFNYNEIDYVEVKLKWKIACETKIYFDDHQVGKIKLKAKGKCNCEVWREWRTRRKEGSNEEDNETER